MVTAVAGSAGWVTCVLTTTAAILQQCILPADTDSGLNEPDSAAALGPQCVTEPCFILVSMSIRTTYPFLTQSGVNLIKINRYELLARWSRRSKAEHRPLPQQT